MVGLYKDDSSYLIEQRSQPYRTNSRTKSHTQQTLLCFHNSGSLIFVFCDSLLILLFSKFFLQIHWSGNTKISTRCKVIESQKRIKITRLHTSWFHTFHSYQNWILILVFWSNIKQHSEESVPVQILFSLTPLCVPIETILLLLLINF